MMVIAVLISAPLLRLKPVATSPGWKQYAVTPVPSSRRASSRVNMMLASFVSPYRVNPRPFHERSALRSSNGMSLPLWASEEVVMIRAGADALSRSSNRVVSRNGARWLSAQVRSMPSSVSSRFVNVAPALLIEHVDAGVARERLVRQSAHRRLRAQVGVEDVDLRSPLPLDARDRLRTACVVAGHDRELGPAPGERLRRRKPDAAGGARDQDALIPHPGPFSHR